MIILVGLAGSGKSTQGRMLAEATGRVWLSVGEVLRNTGEFDEIMNVGKLVDNSLVIKIMAEEMSKIIQRGKNIILDGFPRDAEQAEWVAKNMSSAMEKIIELEVPKAELYHRLEARGRADDTREAIEQRFAISEQNISKICTILGDVGIPTVKVDGVGAQEEVFERLIRVI